MTLDDIRRLCVDSICLREQQKPSEDGSTNEFLPPPIEGAIVQLGGTAPRPPPPQARLVPRSCRGQGRCTRIGTAQPETFPIAGDRRVQYRSLGVA